LAFFLGLSLTSWRLVLISADGDPCLHWRIGNWMIEHRAVIRADQFSHTRFGALLVSKEWLSEVLFAVAGNLLGWNGIVLLSAALIATTLWLLHRQLVFEGDELLLSTALVLLASRACALHWLARPHLTTHLLTVVFAWQLRRFDRAEISGKKLVAVLAPLMLLWANVHGAFFIGFVLIGIYFLGALWPVSRHKMLALGTTLVACVAASLINPNGWRLHAQVIEFLRTPILASLTNEFRSPNFHSNSTTGFSMELLALALMLLVARPRLRPMEVMLIGVWGYFALHSVRNVPVFALVITPILAEHLNAFLSGVREVGWLRLYQKLSNDVSALNRTARGGGLVVFAVTTLLLVAAKPRLMGGAPVIATEPLTNRFPVAAVEFLKKTPNAIHGNMFNDYGWGGYLMLVMPERKVFIDGRNDFYGPDLVKDFNAADEVHPGWNDVLQKYDVGWTILPVNHPLSVLLSLQSNRWNLAYQDNVTAIYRRRE
jgi:hypothetical protein